jgi:hypothetical protein
LEIRVKRGEERRRFLGFGEEGHTLKRRRGKEARKLAYLSVSTLVRGKGALELEGHTIVGKQDKEGARTKARGAQAKAKEAHHKSSMHNKERGTSCKRGTNPKEGASPKEHVKISSRGASFCIRFLCVFPLFICLRSP